MLLAVHLLYFWTGENYFADLSAGMTFCLNQGSPLLHAPAPGESLWAFTRRADGAYVMAAELVIRAKTRNPAGFRYGRFRVWGDLHQTRYFSTGAQSSAEGVLRSLSPRMKASILGKAFQGRAAVRRLTLSDHLTLTAHCRGMALEPRAQPLPEDLLERDEPAPLVAADAARRRVPRRDPRRVLQLRQMYGHRCQLCGWSSGADYGAQVAEAHHIHWLSLGGADSLDNMMLLCPNHHRLVHSCQAQLDFGDLHLDFGGGRREPLRTPGHLSQRRATP